MPLLGSPHFSQLFQSLGGGDETRGRPSARPEVYFFYTVFAALRKKALRFQVGAPDGHRIDSLSGFCAFPSAVGADSRLVFSAVLGSVRKDA
jgi:hypothetical protein